MPTLCASKDQKSFKINKSIERRTMALFSNTSTILSRQNWSNKFQFIFSCIGYAVGLGNIWRFPYLCYENGGAAFLIPYFIFLIICGIPLFKLEISLGQFSSNCPITLWKICPLFKGVGYGLVITSAMLCIYYNVIMSWALYYFIYSFFPTLPWSIEKIQGMNNKHHNVTFFDASKIFYSEIVLNKSTGLFDINFVCWHLFGCLIFVWIITFICVVKGVQYSGKIMQVTATLPYVIFLIFTIRAGLLPGAVKGLKYFIIPNVSKLLEIKVWITAAHQMIFNLGTGLGAVITYSSYNKFHNNLSRDSIIVPLVTSISSVFFGLSVFAMLGNLANDLGSDIHIVDNESGIGLIFIAFPAVMSQLQIPQLWSVMFFFTILLIGMDSQFAMLQTVTCSLLDQFPKLRRFNILLNFTLCFLFFCCGIICVTDAGYYIILMLNDYVVVFTMIFFSLCETIAVAYIYGIKRFVADIELMLQSKLNIIWTIMWMFLTPLTLLILLIGAFYTTISDIALNNNVQITGIVVANIVLFIPIIYGIYIILHYKYNRNQKLFNVLVVKSTYGPKNYDDYVEYEDSLKIIKSNYLWIDKMGQKKFSIRNPSEILNQ